MLDRERADFRATQRAAVAAERTRNRAHVRPRADAQVERHRLCIPIHDVERMHGRTPHRHLHFHPAPVQPVCTLAVDLHRRGGRHPQFDLAAQMIEVELVRRVVPLDHVALDVAGRRRRRQVDRRQVALVEPDERRRELRRAPREDEEQPGREWIERARVPGARSRHPPDLRDDRERRRAGGLVDERDACGFKRSRGHVAPRTRRG